MDLQKYIGAYWSSYVAGSIVMAMKQTDNHQTETGRNSGSG